MSIANSAAFTGPLDLQSCSAALSAHTRPGARASFYGVRTTRIFCRPGCASRRPRPENVVFFSSPAEAVAAGFRPCKRCQPDGQAPGEALQDRILRACSLLETTEANVPLKTLARAAGVSPFHFQRLFKARLGVTPKQYQLTCRMDRFKTELRRRNQVGAAVYAAGFGSSSRAYEQAARRLGMSPRKFQTGGKGLEIVFARRRTMLGWILLAQTRKGVCMIELGETKAELLRRLEAAFPRARLEENAQALKGRMRTVLQYLAQPPGGLSLPLDIHGTAFQHRVWAALQRIPPGKTASYQEVARRIGTPRAVRAVARACAANRLAFTIPCHRVIRSDGSLGGFRWGLERKRQLLAGEKRKPAGK